MPITDLYIALIPDKQIEKVYSQERQRYIESTSNGNLRNQRYYVWKLLEYALKNSFGLNAEEVQFDLNEQGKWYSEKCHFSLSHSKNIVAVAVAVADTPVGVDIECVNRSVSSTLYKKILTDKELSEYNHIEKTEQNNYLIKKWTAKESIFKMGEEKLFQPKKIEITRNIYTDTMVLNDIPFYFSVTNENIENLRIFKNIEL